MFGAKYIRLKFWIISVCLLISFVMINFFAKTMENLVEYKTATFLYSIMFIIFLLWINTLANRIRDYGNNPWISLFALLPLVNVFLALYYGILKSKSQSKKNDNKEKNETSLTKAVINHSKDIVSEIKPAISGYREKHSSKTISTSTINEDDIYEKIMIEIEEDKKVKSTWAKALSQSDGDDKKAQSLYIKMRVDLLKEEKLKDLKNEFEEEIKEIHKEVLFDKNIEKDLLSSITEIDKLSLQYKLDNNYELLMGNEVIDINTKEKYQLKKRNKVVYFTKNNIICNDIKSIEL